MLHYVAIFEHASEYGSIHVSLLFLRFCSFLMCCFQWILIMVVHVFFIYAGWEGEVGLARIGIDAK